MLQAQVAGGGGAAVFLVMVLEVRMAGGKVPAELPRGIPGAVIDQDDLEPVKGLGRNAFQTLQKVFFNIVNRNDDADLRFHGVHLFMYFFSRTSRSTVFLVICKMPHRFFRISSPMSR